MEYKDQPRTIENCSKTFHSKFDLNEVIYWALSLFSNSYQNLMLNKVYLFFLELNFSICCTLMPIHDGVIVWDAVTLKVT